MVQGGTFARAIQRKIEKGMSNTSIKLWLLYQASLTLRINGRTILRADIDEVNDFVNLWASPRRGKPPAPGLIRAVTVFYNDDLEDLGISEEAEEKEDEG